MDVVHAHGLKAGWTAALVRQRLPLVVTVHNTVLPGQGGLAEPVLRRLERVLAGRADAVIATSAPLGGALAPFVDPARLWVIPPIGPAPAPGRSTADVRRGFGVPAGAPLVVGVGRLHRQKGWPTLLDAAARLRDLGCDLRVVVVGEGPQEAELRAQIDRLGLAGTVVLAGPVDQAGDVLAAADVVVVPSVWESGPLVLAEAMALGRPVVSTPVGFAPVLVEDGATGRLVPIGDALALAAAVADLLRDATAAAALGRAGAARVGEVLAPDRLADEVVSVYRDVLGRR
jgi:glycosyltransferase involved in cell wall biosynthesis